MQKFTNFGAILSVRGGGVRRAAVYEIMSREALFSTLRNAPNVGRIGAIALVLFLRWQLWKSFINIVLVYCKNIFGLIKQVTKNFHSSL